MIASNKGKGIEAQLAACRRELVEALEGLLVCCGRGEDGWIDSSGHPGARWAGERLVQMGLWERRTAFAGGPAMDKQWYRKVVDPSPDTARG